MVNIHHHALMAPVPGADALALFDRQWSIYRKCIDNDSFSGGGAYRTSHRVVKRAFSRPPASPRQQGGRLKG